jgi:hypothetical protein
LRIKDTVPHIRTRLPATIATVHEVPSEDPLWIRVQLRVERLDWVPSVLASLDRPFVIDNPPALRDLVHALARRLNDYADAPG